MATIERDFVMYDEDFEFLRSLAYDYTGIVLADHKRDMVYSRLARRMRALGLQQFGEYCELLKKEKHPEHNEFINSITTNLTSFFREPHHFDFLKSTVVPKLLKENSTTRRVRIWSAGCSTGEEAYTIAMTLRETALPSSWDTKILATDLDSNVLEKGRSGIYGADRVEGLSQERIGKFFKRDRQKGSDRVKVKSGLQDLVWFKRLNLLEEWPMKGPFDFIFCRNVVIYFNKETQKLLFDRMADLMPVGCYLFIGHSENITKVCDRFKAVGRTIYVKTH